MKDIFEPLSNDELDWLDRFIIYRFNGDADVEGKDEGVLCVSELDGLLTAVVSGPVLVPPSKWLPQVWGDFQPAWKDEREVKKVMSLMMRHMNGILRLAIAPNAREIHAFWLARREQDSPTATVRGSEPKLGRNDPCFCGSGKKFKKCCLH